MALPTVEPKSLLQRVRRLILGKEKPNLLTRISCGVGLVLWIYLVSWHILTFVALFLFDTLKSSDVIRASFNRVGGRYIQGDPINHLLVYSLLEIAIYFVMLVGLILIYRKKKLGFLLFVFGGLATFLGTFLIMGYDFLMKETSIGDLLLLGAAVAYFGLGALIFYRKKSGPEPEPKAG